MVIISSFYNEEYLLPWWLKHHKDLGHGVLFDFFSTDSSADLIKEICPSWDVRVTKHMDWDPRTNDEEFMEAEREFDGYKITLTTTEFLVGDLSKLTEPCYSIPIIRMVDLKPDEIPTYDKSLIEQKPWGFEDTSFRKRFIHNQPDGRYNVGRDRTSLKSVSSDLKILKFVFSPWTEEFKKRRLQMTEHMSKEHLENRGWGRQHKLTPDKLEAEYQKALKEDICTQRT